MACDFTPGRCYRVMRRPTTGYCCCTAIARIDLLYSFEPASFRAVDSMFCCFTFAVTEAAIAREYRMVTTNAGMLWQLLNSFVPCGPGIERVSELMEFRWERRRRLTLWAAGKSIRSG